MPKYEEAHKEHINKYKMAHMIGVAEYMRERAVDYGLDPNMAYTVGLLHDIGYLEGRKDHENAGAEILLSLGIEEESEVFNAVCYHGSNPYALSSSITNSSLLVLVYEADLSVDVKGYRVGFENRLKDIGKRYGFDSIAYSTAKSSIEFVKEYQEKNYIDKPKKEFFQSKK